MSEQELVLLGLLKESPKHGYEIKKNIKEMLGLFAGLELKSIYYPLSIYEKKGLLVKRSAREGKRPSRIIYALTPKGEARFQDLLQKNLLDFKRPRFSLDLSLYFLPYLSPSITKRKLRARVQVLEKLSVSLGGMVSAAKEKGAHRLELILEHNQQMVDTERQFLLRLIKTL